MYMGSFRPASKRTQHGYFARATVGTASCGFIVPGIAFLLTILLLPAVGLSQGVTVGGLSFPVEAIDRASGGEVLVRLGGVETLTTSEAVERFVVETTLGDQKLALRLEAAALLRFAEECFKREQFEWAGLALRAMRWRPAAIEDDLVESFDVLSEGSSLTSGVDRVARAALLPLFEPERYPRLTARLVLAAGVRAPEWVRQFAIAYAYGAERAMKERLQSELTERLRRRDLEGAAFFAVFAREVYGQDTVFVQSLTLRIERFREILRAVTEDNVDALGRALATEIADSDLRALVGPLAMEGLHMAATRSLEAGDLDGALEILARVDTLKRTPTTHQLTSTALERLHPRPGSALQRAEVLNYLDFIARHDESLAQLYKGKLTEAIDLLLEAGKGNESEPLLDRLKQLVGSSDPLLDTIRVRQARAYFGAGFHSSAERKLREVSAGSFRAMFLRFQLAIVNMSVETLGVLLLLCFLLIVRMLVSIKRGGPSSLKSERLAGDPSRSSSRGVGGGSGATLSQPEEEDAPRGFVVNELRRMSPSAQEYQRCLAVLGLTPHADLRAIKNAYRKLVKDVHPDRHKNQDEEASNRFIELTRTYDRILELRKEFRYED